MIQKPWLETCHLLLLGMTSSVFLRWKILNLSYLILFNSMFNLITLNLYRKNYVNENIFVILLIIKVLSNLNFSLWRHRWFQKKNKFRSPCHRVFEFICRDLCCFYRKDQFWNKNILKYVTKQPSLIVISCARSLNKKLRHMLSLFTFRVFGFHFRDRDTSRLPSSTCCVLN